LCCIPFCHEKAAAWDLKDLFAHSRQLSTAQSVFPPKKFHELSEREREKKIFCREPPKKLKCAKVLHHLFTSAATRIEGENLFLSTRRSIELRTNGATPLNCFVFSGFFFLLELCRGRSKQAQTKVEPLRQRTGKV
jgi:hypothetical protein